MRNLSALPTAPSLRLFLFHSACPSACCEVAKPHAMDATLPSLCAIGIIMASTDSGDNGDGEHSCATHIHSPGSHHGATPRHFEHDSRQPDERLKWNLSHWLTLAGWRRCPVLMIHVHCELNERACAPAQRKRSS